MHPRNLFPALAFALAFLAAPLSAPAQAQESLYTVSGIHVDGSGPSSSEAYNAAIANGRARAFQILYRRLTRQADWGRQPVLDTNALVRLTRGNTISNERRSTTRYVADVTYIFNSDAVGKLLRAAQIAYAQGAAKHILVVPMSPGVSAGPWSQALMSPAFREAVVPFSVTSAEDDAQLVALNFDAATWSDVAPVAARYHVTEAALVQAVYANGKMTVNIRRLGLGEASAKSSVEVPMLQTLGTTYPAAAQAAVAVIADLWKTRSAVDFSQRGRITADVRIDSLGQWGQIEMALGGVANVSGVTVTAMDSSYARLVLNYVGGLDQLREACAATGLTLTNRGGQWTLATTP